MAIPALPPVFRPASQGASRRELLRKAPTPTWLVHPQRTRLRRALFQVHLWSGLILGVYIVVVCVSGSALVFRNDIYDVFEKWIREGKASNQDFGIWATYEALRWIGELHGRLLLGARGIVVNAIGGFLTAAVCVTGLIVWWPGIRRWKRAMVVRPGVGWRRLNFDLHSALGFWTFLILFMWGITGGYFVYPEPFRALINVFTPIDPPRVAPAPAGPLRVGGAAALSSAANGAPGSRAPRPVRRRRPLTTGGKILRAFSFAHYGNFAGWKIKTLWTLLGLAPVLLFGTALAMWWNRVLGPAWKQLKRGWTPSPGALDLASEIEVKQE
jgi:uncharacterized iron-regulated membrane protein